MKRILVTRFGGPDVLEVQDVPKPVPSADEVLVKVAAAGVNYADIMQREGLYPSGPQPPFGAGFEFSGTIEVVGASVKGWRVGEPVMGLCANGYSEYVVANPFALLRKPDSLSFQEAAAIPCQYLTAYHALRTLSGLQEGQTVLIQAAAGGLGTMLVQIARLSGAIVIGACGTDEKCALIKNLGCQHVINYRSHDFEAETRHITNGAGCDLIIESVGGDIFDKSINCLKSRGRLVVLGVASKEPRSVLSVLLLARNLTVSGFHLSDYLSDLPAMKKAIDDLYPWIESGKLRVIARHAYPLEKAREAHMAVSERGTVGKVVLTVGG